MIYRPNYFDKSLIGTKDKAVLDGNIFAREIEITGNLNDIIYGEFFIPDQEKEKIKPKLNAKISAVGLMEGQEFKDATMVVEEFLSTNMRPLLNYIFFDNASSDILDRYYKLEEPETNSFTNRNLCNKTTIATYHDVLNILGLRLKDNPDASLNLTGCNSGKESGGMALSQRRAETIKSYLTDIWKINSNRINLNARNLPEIASGQNEPDGMEENRRVEFKSPSWDVMRPVVTEDTLRKVSPPVIRFYVNTDSENDIKEWKITALQNGTVLRVFEGKGKVPESIDWQIDREKETVPKFTSPIEYMIELTDNKDYQSLSETGLLPTEMITIQKKKDNRVGDKRIDRYSLILFDFASANLSAENTNIIDYIKSNIKTDSRLLISGFTDRTDNEDANFKLS